MTISAIRLALKQLIKAPYRRFLVLTAIVFDWIGV